MLPTSITIRLAVVIVALFALSNITRAQSSGSTDAAQQQYLQIIQQQQILQQLQQLMKQSQLTPAQIQQIQQLQRTQMQFQAQVPQQGVPSGTVAPPAPQQLPEAAPQAAALPKRPGVTRIGLVLPRVTWPGAEALGGPDTVAEQVRQLATSFLNSPSLELLPIAARVPSFAASEAKTKECDQLLAITVVKTPGKSKAGIFGAVRNVAPQLGMIPGLAAANRAAVLTGTVAAVAMDAAANIAGTIQPKDGIAFRYDLTPVAGGPPSVSGQATGKATNAGEDLLSPMITAMAEGIAAKLKPAQ